MIFSASLFAAERNLSLINKEFGQANVTPKAEEYRAKAQECWGFLLLIPALAAAGGSGFVLSKGARVRLVRMKLKRMPFIATNGILVLIPFALFLQLQRLGEQTDMATFIRAMPQKGRNNLNGEHKRACEIMQFDTSGRQVRGEALYGAVIV